MQRCGFWWRIAIAALLCVSFRFIVLFRQVPVVEFPRTGTPIIFRGGGPLRIDVRYPCPLKSHPVPDVSLSHGGLTVPLGTGGADAETGPLGAIEAAVPEDVPPGAYDLRITAKEWSRTITNAVHVVEAFPDEFRFVHISDLGVSAGGTDPGELRELAEEINGIQPAFVLFSGDACDKATWPEYRAFVRFLSAFEAPIICAPGNHDYKGWAGYLTRVSNRPYHATQYGNLRILSLDTAHGRDQLTRSQSRWLSGQLASLTADEWCIVQMHHPVFGRRGVAALVGDFVQVVEAYRVPAVFAGHWHADAVYDAGGRRRTDTADFEGTKFIVTTAAGSRPRDVFPSGIEPYEGYRIVHVKSGKIVSYTHDLDGDGRADPIYSTPLSRQVKSGGGR